MSERTFDVVGTRPVRHDGVDKVTGRAAYGADANWPGMLHGAVLQEPERPVEWVYFPMSGAVSLLVVMKAGEAVEIASVGREGAVGLSVHSGPWRAHTRAIVQVAGVAKAVPAPVLAA